MRQNFLLCYDFETGGLDAESVEITQIGAIILCPTTLEPLEGAEFNSEIRPLHPELLSDDALRVTRKTREKLAEAPLPGEVWGRFTTWCRQFCIDGKTSDMNLPIPVGHNIDRYDSVILRRYCKQYGPTKLDRGVLQQTLVCNRYSYDTLQLMNYWTEGLAEPKNLSLDYLRKYFGMPTTFLAHDALQDVKDTAVILKKLLSLSRRHAPHVVFKDCCDDDKVAAELARRATLKEKRR